MPAPPPRHGPQGGPPVPTGGGASEVGSEATDDASVSSPEPCTDHVTPGEAQVEPEHSDAPSLGPDDVQTPPEADTDREGLWQSDPPWPQQHNSRSQGAAAGMPPCPEDEVHLPPAPSVPQLCFNSSDKHQSGPTLLRDWKPQTMAQKMRVFEAMERWKAIESTSSAIQEISRSRGPHEHTVWEAAAQWSVIGAQRGNTPLLQAFGYKPSGEQQWWSAPEDGGPELCFRLAGHEQHAGHTWYLVECELHFGERAGGGSVQWPAPRRLTQLRNDLHDPVKLWMGDSYDLHFVAARFAKLGGPPGTTARLSAWLTALAGAINSGQAAPCIAALTLTFFQAPLPEGAPDDVAVAETALRLERGESDSQFGGESVLGPAPSSSAATPRL